MFEVIFYFALEHIFSPKGYVYKPQLVHSAESYEGFKNSHFIAPWGLGPISEPSILPKDRNEIPLNATGNGRVCVSLYGDSFTADITWGNIVAEKLGCDVANYGVGGFGIDQALLRFKHSTDDFARVTLLGFFSEDIARHITRNFDVWVYRPRKYGSSGYATKARYILDSENGWWPPLA